jgi:uncharacterized protein (UPF0147 family)
VYVPFFDFRYSNTPNGIKTQPMIKNEIKTAFSISSDPNIPMTTKTGIVNKG